MSLNNSASKWGQRVEGNSLSHDHQPPSLKPAMHSHEEVELEKYEPDLLSTGSSTDNLTVLPAVTVHRHPKKNFAVASGFADYDNIPGTRPPSASPPPPLSPRQPSLPTIQAENEEDLEDADGNNVQFLNSANSLSSPRSPHNIFVYPKQHVHQNGQTIDEKVNSTDAKKLTKVEEEGNGVVTKQPEVDKKDKEVGSICETKFRRITICCNKLVVHFIIVVLLPCLHRYVLLLFVQSAYYKQYQI